MPLSKEEHTGSAVESKANEALKIVREIEILCQSAIDQVKSGRESSSQECQLAGKYAKFEIPNLRNAVEDEPLSELVRSISASVLTQCPDQS